ncbi:MAG: Holliday junction branch migration protein RuvA [Bacteroidetes bacterium]|nr:Holliday junction branch migration protein RuvA [Bacteroidota bacterium]
MIDSLRGELVERSATHVVVECGGVGYLVYITADALARLPEKGACRMFIHYSVSVDVRSGLSEHKLYGFLEAEERHLFRQLINVQGVSSTIGMAILGARRAEDLRRAILLGDETVLKSVKGIGPKLAQRIVQELGGKLLAEPVGRISPPSITGGNSLRTEALSALISLGLDRAKAERSLQRVLDERKNDPPVVEELIRLALKNS